MKTLPSPDQLKNKVIIKAKKPKRDDSVAQKVVIDEKWKLVAIDSIFFNELG